LGPATSTTLTFTWNTAGVSLGSYTIKANASIVTNETIVQNNYHIDGNVTIALPSAVDVTNVTVSHHGNLVTETFKTWTLKVNVTVNNNGTAPVNCTVNAYYYNVTFTQQIGTSKNITDLPPDSNATLTFDWDCTGLPVCVTYTVKANATSTGGGDEFVDGSIHVRLTGDVSGEDMVTGLDVLQVTSIANFGKTVPPANVYADVSGDCMVTGLDVLIITSIANFGKACPP